MIGEMYRLQRGLIVSTFTIPAFSGEVKLGVLDAEFTLPGGIRKHSGLRHVTLHNVAVGDNCCIENIQNYIANYEIGNDTFIENVDIILVDRLSTFR